MFSKFKKKRRKIFLDYYTAPIYLDEGEKVDVILSPSLYWVKELNLSLSLREVKKLLPSIFEDILPEGNYSYFVYKDDDKFFAFAFEDKKILELLREKNIPLSSISSVHLAQSEFKNLYLSTPLLINKQEVIYSRNGIVLVGPREWFDEVKKLNLDEVQLSKIEIRLKQYGDLVDSKHLKKIAIIIGLTIFVLIAQIFITEKKIDKIEAQKENLIQKYHLKQTMFQNIAILNHYKEIFNKQLKVRQIVGKILKIKLNKSEKITLIQFDGKKILVKIGGISNYEKGQKVIQYLNKENLKFNYKFKNNQMQLEVEV